MDFATRQLQQQLKALGHHPEVIVFRESTGSTNDDAKQLAAQGVNCALVASRQQTQGRGQHQRIWLSPMGNVYLSVLLPCNTALDGRLALEVGLNMINLPSLQDLPLQLKWPNDVYSPLGKLGGILIEPISPNQLVVGVGINLFTPTLDAQALKPDQPQSQSQPMSSLSDLGYDQRDALALVAQLYHAILQALQWFEHGSYRLAQRYQHHAAFLGQRVRFEHAQGVVEGVFQGIHADGAACIATQDEQLMFYKGSLKPLDGFITTPDASRLDCETDTKSQTISETISKTKNQAALQARSQAIQSKQAMQDMQPSQRIAK